MLSETAGMASKSYLLFLVLIVMFVSASARRPSMVENHEASEPLPPSLSRIGKDGKMLNDGYAPETDKDEKPDAVAKGMMNEKTDDGSGKLKTDSTVQSAPSAIGMFPIIPGGDGSFHFALGPIDFGGNIGWGGYSPGYVVPYTQPQPYVVVSPYMSQYPIPRPYLPPWSGYGQGQPPQGYSGSYAPSRSYAQGSSQMGGSASNGNN